MVFFLLTQAGVIVLLVIELALSEDSSCPNFAEIFSFAFCQISSAEQMLSHQQQKSTNCWVEMESGVKSG